MYVFKLITHMICLLGTNRTERKMDKFLDCHCSRLGRTQAANIPSILASHHGGIESFDAVITSPLSRAMITALIGFSTRLENIPMIVHPDCRESGSGIPENKARKLTELKRDTDLNVLPRFDEIDFSLLPPDWPLSANQVTPSPSLPYDQTYGNKKGMKGNKGCKTEKKVDKSDKYVNFLNYLRELPYQKIAVVCHFNVIRSLLRGIGHVENALPIPCILDNNGIYHITDQVVKENTEVGNGGSGGGSVSCNKQGKQDKVKSTGKKNTGNKKKR